MGKAGLNWHLLLALFCCAGLALAPALAEARAGSSYGGRPSSFGSRGARSWESNGAQPLSRSPAPQTANQPSLAPGMHPPSYGRSFVQRHPFLAGLAGGLFGSWLFGHAANAAGGGGGAMMGAFLWFAIIGLLVWFGVRLFRARSLSSSWSAVGPRRMARSSRTAPAGESRGRDLNPTDADLQAFQRLHAAVQRAWSAGDLATMRPLMTPGMLDYFSQELTRNTSRGLRNLVSDVHLISGELTEAWEEGELQYATAFLRWRAIDYVVRLALPPGDRDGIAGGDPRAPVEVEEAWTFVRRHGGDWLLSAIQQV